MAAHSSTLAWKIPWTEEPGRLQSMGSRRVGHDWATSLSLFSFTHWRRRWQPTPVFLPGESQGQGSLVGCCLWVPRESARLKQLSSSSIMVSWHSLARALLRVCLALGTFPEVWGRQNEWRRYLILKHGARFCDVVAVNEDPLLLWSDWGSPNRGTICFSKTLQTSVALSASCTMSGRETTDQIANICWIIKKAREFQKSIYFCFTDYTKAFDCVDHNKLWKILKEMGLPDHLTCLLWNLYAGQEAKVRTGHGTTDWFQIGKGVHQVFTLTPCLFNLYAEYIMWNARLDEAQAGIKIARRNINNLRYTDATTLMSESEELKSLLMKVKEKSEKVGLKPHCRKTASSTASNLPR